MFSSTMKFRHKVYLIASILLTTFLVSNLISQWNVQHISSSMEHLKERNENLQSTLILLADIEKLKRYIDMYTVSGDISLKAPIDNLFKSIASTKINTLSEDKNFTFHYSKLIENIKKYRESFKIAQDQIPLSFSLRNNLRLVAQKIEDSIGTLIKEQPQNDVTFKLIVIKKELLEAEKGVVRYFETDDIRYVRSIHKTFKNIDSVMKTLSSKESDSFDMKEFQQLSDSFEKFKQATNKTIEHYRTYSMLTKVVMPGDTYEINIYAQKLRNATLEGISDIKEQIDYYTQINQKIYYISGFIYTVLIIGSIFLVIRFVLSPLKELTDMFEKLALGEEDVAIPEYKTNDEIGKLIKSAAKYKMANKQTKELLKITQDYKENLEQKVQEEIHTRREREKALIQQSKMAAMGEMIGAIAHQWRQPLNELTIRIQKLKYNYAKEQIDEEFITSFIEKNKKTIEFMSHTIDDFRNFFRIDKEKKPFLVKEAIEEILNIQNAQLKNHNIEVEISGEEFSYEGFKTEFQQVIMNIISNSKDAFVQTKTQKPKIEISISDKQISISDNAGGISQKVLERIFEPYFTTKEQGEGTGMGLYMSKMIIEENMSGKIFAKNYKDGVQFTIDFSNGYKNA